MKPIQKSLVLLTIVLLGSVMAAQADVAVSFSSGHRQHNPHYDVRYRGHSAYYHRNHYPRYYARPRYYAPYSQVVVVPQPYYVQPTPAPVTGLSGDYGQDLAEFRERLSRLRAIVDRQKEKGGIEPTAHERFTQTLDAIEKDQRARAYNRGGNLSSQDFADLFHRLDQTDEDIELVLAQ